MITASIVAYRTKISDMLEIISCAKCGGIEIIWVIDNSPTDELRHQILKEFNDIRYVYGQGNIGYGSGHNIAIQASMDEGADYHVVLNPDISFNKNVIHELKLFMDTHKDAGCILPQVYYPNGDLQYLCKLLPTPIDIIGRRLLPSKCMARRNYHFEMRSTGYDKTINVPSLSGCFMFIRIKTLREVGLFDERFFMYFEDTDLIRRLHKVSKTVFYPKVSIIHNHAAEHRHNNLLLKISVKAAISYFNKWGWIFDKERRYINRHAFDQTNYIK